MSKRLEEYSCIICLDVVKTPYQCQRCHKMVCKVHLRKIADKCPNCRLKPMNFVYWEQMDKQIKSNINRIRIKQKETQTFICLVQKCEFKGKFAQMQKHRKEKHPQQNIDEIIFADVRETNKGRQLFFREMMTKMCSIKPVSYQKAFFLYVQVQGKCQLFHLVNMSIHTNRCDNQKCKKVHIVAQTAFIGDQLGNRSSCPQAESMKAEF